MITREFAQSRARLWRELALTCAQHRDKAASNLPGSAWPEYWQSEYDDRMNRAKYWQNLADGPFWKRWFK